MRELRRPTRARVGGDWNGLKLSAPPDGESEDWVMVSSYSGR